MSLSKVPSLDLSLLSESKSESEKSDSGNPHSVCLPSIDSTISITELKVLAKEGTDNKPPSLSSLLKGEADRTRYDVNLSATKRQGTAAAKTLQVPPHWDDHLMTAAVVDDEVVCMAKVKTYKDNPQNRRLDRVGLPCGSKPFSTTTKSIKQPALYVDNALNRAFGRVGKVRGSLPISSYEFITKSTEKIQMYMQYIKNNVEDSTFSLTRDIHESFQHAVESFTHVQLSSASTCTSCPQLKGYSGPVIDYGELIMDKKIGHGSFGDVYYTKWRGGIVATKKLRMTQYSKNTIKQFVGEATIFYKLDHPNIVRFYGVSTKLPNYCIVMEYMELSLFEVLHLDMEGVRDLTERDQKIITQQTISGLNYLHANKIAHCDIKPRNILLSGLLSNSDIQAKISDFGLSMLKNHDQTTRAEEFTKHIGTPRYSAPEVLGGQLIGPTGRMNADMYSFGLVVFEIYCRVEPFALLTYEQLRVEVGTRCNIPTPPPNIHLDPSLYAILKKCWNQNPNKRPKAMEFIELFAGLNESFFKEE